MELHILLLNLGISLLILPPLFAVTIARTSPIDLSTPNIVIITLYCLFSRQGRVLSIDFKESQFSTKRNMVVEHFCISYQKSISGTIIIKACWSEVLFLVTLEFSLSSVVMNIIQICLSYNSSFSEWFLINVKSFACSVINTK